MLMFSISSPHPFLQPSVPPVGSESFPWGEVNIGALQLLVCWALCFLVRSHKVRAEAANIKTAYNLLSHTFQCELLIIYAIVIYTSISHHMWETDCGTDQWSWKIIPAHHRVETQVAALLTLQISCLQCTIFKMTHSHPKKISTSSGPLGSVS